MAPERSPKRQKTLPDSNTPSTSKIVSPNPIPLPPDTSTSNLASSVDSGTIEPQRSSWYASWSRKAPPITQVARESIKVAGDAASEVASTIRDVSTTPKSIRSPSLAMTLGKARSSRASLADVTTTMVHAEAKSPSGKSTKSLSIDSNNPLTSVDTMPKIEAPSKKPPENVQPTEQVTRKEDTTVDGTGEQNQRSSWLGWLAKGDGVSTDQSKGEPESKQNSEPMKEPEPLKQTEQLIPKPQMQEAETATASQSTLIQPNEAGRKGWFQIWSSENDGKTQGNDTDGKAPERTTISSAPKATQEQSISQPPKEQTISQSQDNKSDVESSAPPTLPHDGTKASGWAFWSRERKANDSSSTIDRPREGEIAVSDTPSQNKPRRTSISVPNVKDDSKTEAKKPEPKKSEPKMPEPKPAAVMNEVSNTAVVKTAASEPTVSHRKKDSKAESVTIKTQSSNATAQAVEPVEDKKPASITSSKAAHNLLLPKLHATLKLPENPSFLLRLANLLYATREPDLSHLSLTRDPPRIKNALAIGVHGYFPTPLIRSVLGQPTGTSIKFADMAAKSIKRWTAARGYECQVKTAALEGEGKIAERLELLWKLLLNWIEEIRNSDYIMVACHSQGVPVAIMLVAKLIQFGCISSTRVCICAMAGVNMGPFPEYKSRWIGGSAGELFEFSDPLTRVSQDYLAALNVVLKSGVRLTFIGSIDDQLVSLESSIYATISHPNIFRAVSIDSRVHAPNFLSHLVGFALKLRNLGVQDHGLIRELSSPLAGSLYTGEGHSRIYEDDAVYDLAVAFSLETTTFMDIPPTQRTVVSGGSNPYILPFAMRGILEEEFVKNELQNEASELLREFDEWKPTSKVLKDVKFRLEGIRLRL